MALASLALLLVAGCALAPSTVAPVPAPQPSATTVPLVSPATTSVPATIALTSVAAASGATTTSVPHPPSPTPVPTLPDPPFPDPSPQPPAPPPVSFAVIGDYGWHGQGTQDVAALIAGWNPDVILTVGDNNYPDGEAWTMQRNVLDHYGRFIDEGRFFPALGNHDMTADWGQAYFDTFELPGNERYYDFVRGDVHFFAVNSDWREPDGIGAGSRQAAWLQEGLQGSTTAWQIVYFHAPPHVSLANNMVPALRWPFAEWGADLVLSGHAHLYERLTVEGLPYIVNGLGGFSFYPFDEQPHPASQVRFNSDFGALHGTVTAADLRLQFVTRAGIVVDDIVLHQPSP